MIAIDGDNLSKGGTNRTRTRTMLLFLIVPFIKG